MAAPVLSLTTPVMIPVSTICAGNAATMMIENAKVNIF
jgi:hypothetical protein